MSYKIIKNNNISYEDAGITISDIQRTDSSQDAFFLEETQEEQKENIDIEIIKAEIKNQLDLENKLEKQKLLDRAMNEFREEAENLKKDIIEQGFKEGLKQGYKKGMEDCKDECNEMKKGALSLISQAKEEVKKYYKTNKDNFIKLAADMAESIVHTTIDSSSEDLLLLIKPIIDLNDRFEIIIITCHPDNHDFLKNNKTQLEISAPNARFVILSDNNLEKNGCIIENENQVIDLQIRKQLNSILKDIMAMEG